MVVELVVLFAALILLTYIFNWVWSSRGLPPGPPRYPLVGSLPSLMLSSPQYHKSLTDMAKTYGDVFTLYLPTERGCKPNIVINSFAAAREALVVQKDAFSGRPSQFTTNLVSHGGKGFGFSDFNATLVYTRKIVHSALRLYQPHLEEKILTEANEIVRRFESKDGKPFDPKMDFSLAISNVIYAIMYGRRFDLENKEFIESVQLSDSASKFLGALNIYNFFPWLIYLPLPDTKLLYKVLENRAIIRDSSYFEAKKTFQENTIRHLVDALLQAKLDCERDGVTSRKVRLDDVDLVAATGSLFGGGTDTTSAALRWLIAYLLNYPKVQEKIYREIQTVFGKAPIRFDKRNGCHYLQATLTEVLRITSIGPLFVHKTTCTTTLYGYSIPKDTTVILNFWAINHDERKWKNPNQFNPERFLDSEGNFTGTMKMSYMPFGAGRRVCIGELVAKEEFFLVSATLLQKFKFEIPPDCSPPDLNDGFLGITYTPKPHKVVASPR